MNALTEPDSMTQPLAASIRQCLVAAAVLVTCSCQYETVAEGANVDSGIAVVIGDTRVRSELLQDVRARAPSDLRRDVLAVDEVVTNSVLAYALRHWDPASAEWLDRVGLANRLTVLLWTEARNQGELTQTELDEWTKRHWVTVARPTSARTVHAVVLVDAEKEQGERDRALAVARQVRAAVDGAAEALGRRGGGGVPDSVLGVGGARVASGAPKTIEEFTAAYVRGEWARFLGAARAAGARIGPGRYIETSYEDRTTDPHAEIARLLRFIGLSDDAGAVKACLDAGDFERVTGGRKRGVEAESHYRKAIVGDWRNHLSPEQGDELVRIADAALAEAADSSPGARPLAGLQV